MPVITLNRKRFDKLIGKKLSMEELKEEIAMLGNDLQEINEKEIVVEVFPDRPDMLSEQGFARAFSTFIGTFKGLSRYNARKSNYQVKVDSSVKDVRPFTACCVVKNIALDDEKIREIIQVQEKLHITYGRNRKKVAIGIYPMEKIKWPIRYMAKKPREIYFRPLGSRFSMNGKDILTKNPTGIAYGHLLKKSKKYPIFVDAEDNILSMPPIINSEDTGKIDKKTKELFIEVSGFDINVLEVCLNIIASSLYEMGGDLYEVDIRHGSKSFITPDFRERIINVNPSYINGILGLELNEKEIKNFLVMMGFDYNNKKVYVPSYRADILHQIDIAEDIAIAYGYDNFEGEVPYIDLIGEENEFEGFKEKISGLMTGFGFMETNSHNLIGKHEQLDYMSIKGDVVGVENSNEEYNSLRSWIIPSLLKILASNKHNDYPQKIFEVGHCFKPGKGDTKAEEFYRMGVLICHSRTNYTEARQVLDSLMNLLELKFEVEEAEHESFIPGRCARVSVEGKKIAYLGEIHPKIITNFNLDMSVSGFEINITELFELVK